MRITFLQIFWPDLLKGMFPKSNINEQTEVIVLSKQYLTDISAIISSTDRQYVNHIFKHNLVVFMLFYVFTFQLF